MRLNSQNVAGNGYSCSFSSAQAMHNYVPESALMQEPFGGIVKHALTTTVSSMTTVTVLRMMAIIC